MELEKGCSYSRAFLEGVENSYVLKCFGASFRTQSVEIVYVPPSKVVMLQNVTVSVIVVPAIIFTVSPTITYRD
jgi:hypothetical protein